MMQQCPVDLRSDTVTQPTIQMRQAMADAEVGDDVYGEDPSVNRLERFAAELLGKEATLLVSSGTMANLISLLTHCQRGDEALMGDQAHMFLYERGGAAVLGGIHPRTLLTAADGSLSLDDVREAVRPDDIHCPRTRLLCLENTQAQQGGQPLSLDYLHRLRTFAGETGLPLHCDGARLWHAAIATRQEPDVLAKAFDSVSVCLSKGLAAPVGSLITGTHEFIREALRLRKLLGGGMRQAGFLAAAGLVALKTMRNRLELDHEHAKLLAEGLQNAGYEITHPVATNIVFFRQHEQDGLPVSERLAVWKQAGLLVSGFENHTIRAVTHYGIETHDIEQAVNILQTRAYTQD